MLFDEWLGRGIFSVRNRLTAVARHRRWPATGALMHVQVKHGDHEDGQMHLFQRKVSRSCGAATSAPSVVVALRHRTKKRRRDARRTPRG